MHYVIGDIHGQFQALLLLLDQIHYNSDEDHLCFVGDYIDWGKESMHVLLFIMKLQEESDKVQAVLGNHELMMLDSITHPLKMRYPACLMNDWYYNKGLDTYTRFFALPKEDQKRIRAWLKNLPIDVDMEVNGRKYVISHSFPLEAIKTLYPDLPEKEQIDEAVWHEFDLQEMERYKQIKNEDITLVRGHRITKTLKVEYVGDDVINIDCGAKAIGYSDSRDYSLACICLETKEIFYVDEKDLILEEPVGIFGRRMILEGKTS